MTIDIRHRLILNTQIHMLNSSILLAIGEPIVWLLHICPLRFIHSFIYSFTHSFIGVWSLWTRTCRLMRQSMQPRAINHVGDRWLQTPSRPSVECVCVCAPNYRRPNRIQSICVSYWFAHIAQSIGLLEAKGRGAGRRNQFVGNKSRGKCYLVWE